MLKRKIGDYYELADIGEFIGAYLFTDRIRHSIGGYELEIQVEGEDENSPFTVKIEKDGAVETFRYKGGGEIEETEGYRKLTEEFLNSPYIWDLEGSKYIHDILATTLV
ncbi:hypothetical protein [Persephonella sp.]